MILLQECIVGQHAEQRLRSPCQTNEGVKPHGIFANLIAIFHFGQVVAILKVHTASQ